MRKVFLLLLILFFKKSAGFFWILNSKTGLLVKKNGGSSFLDKLKEASGNNETETFTLNDRNDKSGVSGGILSSSVEEENTNQCPIKEVVWRYDEEKEKTVYHKMCKTFRTPPKTLCKRYMTKAKKCTPRCYRGKCVNLWKQNQSINEMCRSLIILPEMYLEPCQTSMMEHNFQ